MLTRRGLFGLLLGGIAASFAPKTKPLPKPQWVEASVTTGATKGYTLVFRCTKDAIEDMGRDVGGVGSGLRFIDTRRR